jgi:hypothetical protein
MALSLTCPWSPPLPSKPKGAEGIPLVGPLKVRISFSHEPFLLLIGSSSILGKRSLDDPADPSRPPPASLTAFDDHPFFSLEEMNALKDRMNEFDRQREVVIKKTRDIQKYSKQAVYSFHGKRFAEGREKLQAAKKIADEIKVIIAQVCLPT